MKVFNTLGLSAFIPDAPRFDSDGCFKSYRKYSFVGEVDEYFGASAAIVVDGAVANDLTG